MDNQINEALGKMMRNSVPVKVQRFKHEVIRLQAEIDQRDKGRRSGKISLINKTARRPIDKCIKELREAIDALSAEYLDGVMVPLKEQDLWDCRLVYTSKYNTFRKKQIQKIKDGLSGDDLIADTEAIHIVAQNALITAQVQHSLKKKEKVKDAWVEMFTFDEASRLDPALINELWAIYCDHLVLTAEQLKPSAVSTNQSDQETTTSSKLSSKQEAAAASGSSSPTS